MHILMKFPTRIRCSLILFSKTKRSIQHSYLTLPIRSPPESLVNQRAPASRKTINWCSRLRHPWIGSGSQNGCAFILGAVNRTSCGVFPEIWDCERRLTNSWAYLEKFLVLEYMLGGQTIEIEGQRGLFARLACHLSVTASMWLGVLIWGCQISQHLLNIFNIDGPTKDNKHNTLNIYNK